jgi:hypothetical protein
MRKLVVVLTATGAILLASSVAWKADAQTATGTVVEMVLKPCDPGVPRNQCGVSIHVVKGSASFTNANGETSLQQGEVMNVNGNGELTQSNQADSILNFASAGETTGSVGFGGGGGNTGSPGALGGTNNGSQAGTPTFASTGPGFTGSSGGGVGSASNTISGTQ